MDKKYHNYVFYNLTRDFYHLDLSTQKTFKEEFKRIIENPKNLRVIKYSMLGLKLNATFMLWINSTSIEDTQKFLSEINKSSLGKYLETTYVLFGMERPSVYSSRQTSQEQAVNSDERSPYLIVYPFTKTKEWYFLSMETRRALMNEHIRIGHKFAYIRQNLLYSYGIDDNEFIVSYETDKLEDFQSLIIELRSDEARRYTQNDLPIFTCVLKSVDELLSLL